MYDMGPLDMTDCVPLIRTHFKVYVYVSTLFVPLHCCIKMFHSSKNSSILGTF